jgi:hypothetical protein
MWGALIENWGRVPNSPHRAPESLAPSVELRALLMKNEPKKEPEDDESGWACFLLFGLT